ncbi:imelysin family protein [Rhabdaerophilum sp. SD176]|uniref:imelysin family protein n=1 Tax=Rhabdaerophilum sp. SD176 TaxID=2983548 RepID=UPI0024E02C20|nr:imelysin family protein [Rhabdaerophilum sp. SD176]
MPRSRMREIVFRLRWLLAVIMLACAGWAAHVLLAPPETKKTAFDMRAFLRLSLEGFIRPGYADLLASARRMETTIRTHCDGTDRDDARLENAFVSLLAGWGRIEVVDFGPVAENDRQERLFFWPDRQQIGARQIHRLLASRDSTVTVPENLAGRSVAIQGLTALDRVLWPGATPTNDPIDRAYRCAFAAAIASNIATIAGDLASAWSPGGAASQSWLNPGKTNPRYLEPAEAVLAATKALNRALERTVADRLRLLASTRQGRSEAILPFGRTQRANVLVQANLEGLTRLFAEGGYRVALMLAATRGGVTAVGSSARIVERELATSLATLRSLAALPASGRDDAAVERLNGVVQSLGVSRRQIAAIVGQTTGINLGFNFSDGD